MKILIIGAGPAGVTVAETVRAYDEQAEIQVLTAEPYQPYSPPAMADHFIHGSNAHLWRGSDWPGEFGVDYRAGTRVDKIQPEAHLICLEDGETLAYDKLVIATGSRLFAPLEGADLPGVYNFKSLSAAEVLVENIRSGSARNAVIVGAGFIGMEIALLLRELGVKVIQIEMLDQVMGAMLDTHTAAFALDMMLKSGVDVRLNTKAIAFVGDGRANEVLLESGETIPGDLFIAATGVQPNLSTLEDSGINFGWGVFVDDHLRASVSDIYAAGDVIESPDRLTGETYVHAIFPNAVEQGRVVGLNLAGYDVTYEGAERMNSLKHLGLPVMAVGLKDGDEILHTRHDGGLRTVYLRDNRLVGFQLVGDISAAGILRALLLQEKDVQPFKDRLVDPAFGQGYVVWSAINALG